MSWGAALILSLTAAVALFVTRSHPRLDRILSMRARSRTKVSVLAVIGLVMGMGLTSCRQPSEPKERADPKNVEQVALGRIVYNEHCASCHGVSLEGQPNWRQRRLDGRLPAPPHDMTGHTWEHPDDAIFRVTKQGFQAFAGPQYETDMPSFGNELSDDQIWAVIAYIKSSWPQELLERRRPKDPSAAHEAHVRGGP